jgi:hypothetical protein
MELPYFLNDTDLLFSLFDEINAIISPFSGFNLVQRSSTLTAIQSFKWGHLDAFFITTVVGKLSQR